MLCKNPSDYDGSGKWDKEDSESPDCSSVLVSQFLQFKQLNLTLSDVDSNTCDDYILEVDDESNKKNILRWIQYDSECCGTGGAAKNGCPATLDTESTGSNVVSFGVISFILPILVTALQKS